ncbi:MAG: endonuclease/exonuclease/phosphatase family protein [Bacteroides sp.]|nr:endonuclease/exonuclease/phosphatase family protein [Bacteroides sp.]
MKITKLSIVFILVCVLMHSAHAQNKLAVYSVGFYNLENLFDTDDDPNNRGDDDFTPNGAYAWTPDKYQRKLSNMAKTIFKLAKEVCPAGPALLGVSEIENRRVLEDLVKTEPLASLGLKVIHFDSPDRRGIDVGCLYNPKLFTVTSADKFRYNLPKEPNFTSRDILMVSGILAGEQIHFLVNHWPSRFGGDKSSVYRERAAEICRSVADSVRQVNPEAKVIAVGDLNDDPYNKSVAEVFGAKRKADDTPADGYFNTTWPLFDKGIGSLCFQGKWNLFDQIIISGNLLGKDRSTLKYWKTEIFNKDFLTTQEGKNKGYPWRTFSENTFIEGFSDHFPVLLYLVKSVN